MSNMFTIGNAALVCLLAVAGLVGQGDAARPRELRGGADPWLVSPPGRRPDDNVRRPARDLGEKEFVSIAPYQEEESVHLTKRTDTEAYLPSWSA